MEPISNITALKQYFGTSECPVTNTELKDLSKDERADLVNQIFEITGWTRKSE